MLPDTYFFPGADSRRLLRFNKRYDEAVANGTKVTTVRFDDQVILGPHTFVFEDDAEYRTLNGRVSKVQYHQLDQMTAEQARLAPGTSIAEFRHGLRTHYPALSDKDEVGVVAFEVL